MALYPPQFYLSNELGSRVRTRNNATGEAVQQKVLMRNCLLLFDLEMKNKAEKQSKVICQILEEMHSSYYSFHIKENYVILCQSSDDPEISRTLSRFIQVSLQYFLSNKPNYSQTTPSTPSTHKFHKQRIANLIVSCRQFLQEKNIQGSCAFGICYFCEEKIYCFRSEGIQIFLINQAQKSIKPLSESFKFGTKRRFRNKGIESLYFSTEMPKIKSEFVYEQNDFIKKKIFFDHFDCKKEESEEGQNLKILIGCPETFDLISPQILFKNFDSNSQKSDCEKVNGVLEQAKKNIKSVYRQELSLACWRIKTRHPRSSQS